MKQTIESVLAVPVSDPDDSRRRRLLNIILASTLLAALLGLVGLGIDQLTSQASDPAETQLTLVGAILMTLGVLAIYQINRRYSGQIAALLYLLLLTTVFSFTDTPVNLTEGRSLFLFTIPIIMASLILAPRATFLFAALSSGIIAYLALSIDRVINIFGIIGFFMVALVSWLSARSLEQALQELRIINVNLDQAVIERTQELARALERERIEAGRNQAILNSIADGVVVFDTRWNAILANPSLKGMLEIPIELIVNKNFRELIEHPRLSARSRTLLQAMMDHDTQPPSFRIEWGKKTLSISAAQVYDNSRDRHTNIGTVTVFRDFTREAELERLKSTFVAIVSHELRTPLNAIMGYSEMFKEEIYGPMNEKQLNVAGRIMKNTQRLLGLINDLLDQAQMEAGKLTIHMAPVRPAELLDNLHGVMDQIAHEKGLRLTSDLSEDLPPVLQGDAARLHQILVNLVNNAVKFTGHGEVHVRLFRPSENLWALAVSDSGYGIPEHELPYIFETFRQVESGAARVHGGFGLGLAIVRQLVQLMSGEVRADSTMGAGTTFTITLPLVVPEEIM